MVKWRRPISTALLTLVGLLYIAPILWMILGALKTQVQLFSYVPELLFSPTGDNFSYLVRTGVAITPYMVNSLIVAIASSFIAIAVGTWTAYVLANFRIKRKKDFEFWILSMRMIPALSVVVPFYLMATAVHLYDSRIALVLVYLTFEIPLVVWLMKGFFVELPKEISDAARVDGCGDIGRFWRIALPLVRPGLVSALLLCFIASWNEFPFALYLTSRSAVTMPVALTGFNTENGVLWGPMLAAGTVAALPVFIFSILIRRHLVRGLTMGSVK